MTDKEIYRNYCKTNLNLPIFFYDWWLDIACGENNWNVAISFDKEGKIRAVWPYFFEKVLGFKISRHPQLTPFLGIHIDYPSDMQRQSTKSGFERNVMYQLVKKMPSFYYFRQNFMPEFDNWLPLFWKKYHQTSHYTYILPLNQDIEDIYFNIEYKRRRQIKKAGQHHKVIESDDIKAIYDLNQMSYKRKELKAPYDFDTLQKLDVALAKRAARKIYLCLDKQGNVLAGAYIVKDAKKAYYLLGGVNLKHKGHYPMSLVFWQVIKDMKEQVEYLDFEGSMARKIETVLREYGGTRTSFDIISKTRNRFVDMAYLIIKGRRLV